MSKNFNEIPVICDDTPWVTKFLNRVLTNLNVPFVILKSSTPLRQSWNRFKNCDRFIIYWEGQDRSGGAVVEEILDINPSFDVGDKVVVLTSNPIREDVVYSSELGIKRVMRLRNRDIDLTKASAELATHLSEKFSRDSKEIAWQKIQRALDFAPADDAARLDKIENSVKRLLGANPPSARYLDVMAGIAEKRGDPQKAEKLYLRTLELNPNYFRSYHKLINFYKTNNKHQPALDLLHRLHSLNKNMVTRFVDFGDVYCDMKDDLKAEHYYKLAISRDHYCSGALNGLAKIKFRKGDLEQARELMARTSLAYEFASHLNRQGINMVRARRYDDALDHYTKAQYVLPQKEKGPQLFYNMGLCYSKWKKPEMALQFLKIALIKEPNYKKAQKLLEKIEGDPSLNAA